MKPHLAGNDGMSSSIQIDKQVEPAPARHGAEAILAAVVFGAHKFMHDTDWTGLLECWLERLGVATGADQVRVFENNEPAPGEPVLSSLRAQWIAPGCTHGSPMSELQDIPFRASGCARWEDLLSSGLPVVGTVTEFPESERPIMQKEGIASVAIVPVFVDSKWWGFLGFADCGAPRTWSISELDALTGAANIYGAALSRRVMQERIAAAVAQERLGTVIGEAVTAQAQSLEEILDTCCDLIAHHLQADFVRVWTVARDGEVLRSNCHPARVIGTPSPMQVNVGEYAIGRIAQTREPEIWHGDLPELWQGSLEMTAATGLRAGVAYPLLSNNRVVGVVVLLKQDDVSRHTLEGLWSVTDELALAIDRSRAVMDLVLTEDRYRRLVEATVEGVVIHDGRRVLDGNPALAAMVGYEDAADIIGLNPLDFIHPDDLPAVKQHLAENYTGVYETRFLRRDGSFFPAEVKGRDFMWDGTKLRVTSIRDITERKHAERIAAELLEEQHALEVSERNRQHAEFLADASRILASSFDTTTTLNQLAHLCVRFLADFCVVSLFHDDSTEQIAYVHAQPEKQELLTRSIELWNTQWQGQHELSHRQRSGEPFIIADLTDEDLDRMAPDPEHRQVMGELGSRSLMSVPIVSGGGLIGAIMFSAGADHAPYGAEELALAQELGRRAAVALESAQSYHQARAATMARDEMLAVVAHDLRNPLNTIHMGSSLALELMGERTDAVGRKQFEMILRSADHMNRLIQDLLDATRLQSGQLALEIIPTRATVIIDEALEILQPLATQAGIALEVDPFDDGDPIPVDKLRILQVLSNLVGNAIKFTPRGGSVRLCVVRRTSLVEFCVRDTGPGIAPDQLPHIFGKFWQARATDRRGLGLGLAIAKGIVDAHGGTIWVESKPGVGSEFLFTVPA